MRPRGTEIVLSWSSNNSHLCLKVYLQLSMAKYNSLLKSYTITFPVVISMQYQCFGLEECLHAEGHGEQTVSTVYHSYLIS